MTDEQIKKIAASINAGQIGVMPTDTIYGVVGRADTPAVVERIYNVKKRAQHKKLIKLVGDYNQLKDIGVIVTPQQIKSLKTVWPGPVSVELPSFDEKFKYLHLGTNFQAVRMPAPQWLRELLNLTGPIVATSANVSGEAPSQNIKLIKAQLPGLDFYFKGNVGDTPSKLASIAADGTIKWLERN